MNRRLGALVLGSVLVGHALAGCAGMRDQQKAGAMGAGIGAVVGAATGAVVDRKNPGRGAGIGAATGALLGGATGWAISEYQVRQVKTRQEAAAASGYTASQGIVARIERVTAVPARLRPGETLTFQADYTVLAPPERREVRIRESRTILFDGRRLMDLPSKDLALVPGTNEVKDFLTLPGDAAEGSYMVTTAVEALEAASPRRVQASAGFAVTTAATGVAAAAPRASAPAATIVPASQSKPTVVAVPPPATEPPRLMPTELWVRIPTANLRDGAGAGFKLLTRVPKGTRVEVLEAGGSDRDRWFKVKLPDGQQGWVAASAVSASP